MTMIPKTPSIFIESQFPAIYREEAQELIGLVESYYEFMELQSNQSIYNARRMFEYRDIDTTMLNMLIFYRDKYLKGLPFDEDNIRFIVKNIMELYRRKGSQEGIELFFKLFFDEEVEITYPSYDILKPSTSSWVIGRYLQLQAVSDVSLFSDLANQKIFGSFSKAETFVDKVYFNIINNSIIPIIFISSTKGSFVGSDVIFTTSPVRKEYGRIYGSLQTIDSVTDFEGSSQNEVGDVLEIVSENGRGGLARITNVTEKLSGEISFSVKDGDYGYTQSGTDILVSNQSLFLNGNEDLLFNLNEKIGQTQGGNTVTARVIGQNKQSIGLLLDDVNLPFIEDDFFTIDRITNITKEALFVLGVNSSASAQLGPLKNVETISIIVDLISDFADVPLDSANFSSVPPALAQMSGGNATLSTPINQAFVPQNFEIGSIDKLSDVIPGTDYLNNVFVLARENTLSKFNYRDHIILFNNSNVNISLLVGDVIYQNKSIENFDGNFINVIAKATIVEREGNIIYAKQASFEPFIKELTFYKNDVSDAIEIVSISRDSRVLPLGLNAIIDGKSVFVSGSILEVQVIDSGLGYEHNKVATLNNITKSERYKILLDNAISSSQPTNVINQLTAQYNESIIEISCQGIISSRGQGFTEGQWNTFTSHTNFENGKVLQDNSYYQDFSYDISSSLPPTKFEESLKDVAHPAGMVSFYSFAKLDAINNDINIRREVLPFRIVESLISSEDDNIIISEDGSQYLVSTIE